MTSSGWRETIAFFILTISISWALWIPYAAEVFGSQGLATLFFFAGAFGPLLSAGVVTWMTGESLREWASQILVWRVRPRWYVIALGLPVVFSPVPLTIAFVALGNPIDLSVFLQRIPLVLLGIVFTFFVGGGQEELGWRGFALPRLQRSYGPLSASVVIGVVWAIWHVPLYFTAWNKSQPSFPAYLIALIGLSILFAWLYNNTRGSVFLTMVMHASFNNVGGLIPFSEGTAAHPLPSLVLVVYLGAIWATVFVVVRISGHDLGLKPVSPEPS